MNTPLIDFAGLLGAALLLLAYFMATTKRWDTHSAVYQLANLAAAGLLVMYSFAKTAYVHVGINIVWATVAIVGLVMLSRRHGRKR